MYIVEVYDNESLEINVLYLGTNNHNKVLLKGAKSIESFRFFNNDVYISFRSQTDYL